MRNFFLTLFFFWLGLMAFMPTPTWAATKTWVPSTGGSWTTATNWSPNGVPAAGDVVVVSSTQSANITNVPTIGLSGLQIDGSCTFAAGGAGNILTVTSTFSVPTGVTFSVGASNNTRLNLTLDTSSSGTIAGRVAYSTVGTVTMRLNGDLQITGTGLVNGSGAFNVGSGSTLRIATSTGIASSGSTGAIQVGGTRTFNTGANYVYNGAGAQITGSGLPQTAMTGSVTIASGATVTATNAIITNAPGVLTVQGMLIPGTVTMVLSGTGTLNGSGTVQVTRTAATADFLSQYTHTTKDLSQLTVEYAALSGAQVVSAVTYQHLKLDNTSGINTVGGNVTVNGTLMTAAGGTLNMGSNELRGTLTSIANSGTIRTQNTGATPVPTGKTWTGTMEYDAASGGQTIMAGTYDNLTLNNTSATQTASGILTVNGALTTAAGGAWNMGTFQLQGSLTSVTHLGTLETQCLSAPMFPTGKTWGGAILLDGAAAQTLTTSTFSNLRIANASGVIAESDITVNGSLNLQSANASAATGTLALVNGHVLTMGENGTTAGQGDVTGDVYRAGPFTSSKDYSFGSAYTLINFPTTGTMTGIHVNMTMGSAPSWKSGAIQRWYELTDTPGAGSSTAVMSFHYQDTELNGNTESRMTVWKYDGAVTEIGRATHNTSLNLVTFGPTDFSSFSGTKFTLADTAQTIFEWDGSADTDWTNADNWAGNVVPDANSNVDIPDAATTNFDPQLPNADVEIKTLHMDAGGILYATNGKTLTVNGGSADPPSFAAWDSHGTFNAGTGVVAFTGSSASYAGTTDFYDVVIGPGATLYNRLGSVMRIANTVTNNGTWFAAYALNSTVEYNGTNQTIIQPNGATPGYKNLTISGGGTKTFPSALNITGNFTNDGTYDATGATTTFSGTTDQTIGGSGTIAFRDLSINNPGNTILMDADLTVTGVLQVMSGSTLSMEARDLVSMGASDGAGTIQTRSTSTTPLPAGEMWSGAVRYTAAGGQTIVSGTYQHLSVNETSGAATLGGDVSVGGVLTLTNGVVSTTGAYVLSIGSSGSVSRGSGYVQGSLGKYVSVGSPTVTYEIGDATKYAPTEIALHNVTVPGEVQFGTTNGDHPNMGLSNLDPAKSVNRYWSVTNTGVVFDTYDATFHFPAADIDPGAETEHFLVTKYSAGSWSYPTVGFRNGTSTQATGLMSFSEYMIGEIFDVTPPTITITAPHHILHEDITDTTIRVTDNVAISSSTISLASSTAGYADLVCAQSNAVQVDCTVRITSSGDLTVNAQDDGDNWAVPAVESGYVIDTVHPVVTITAPTHASGTMILDTTIRVTDNMGVASTTVELTGSTAGTAGLACAQTSSTQIDCTLQMTSSGDLFVTATDDAGNDGTSTEVGYVVDSVRPTVTLTSTSTSPTKVSSFSVTVLFSKNVTGFALGDITISNGSASAFATTTPNTVYAFDVTPAGQGTVTVDVAAGAAQDVVGNTSTAATTLTRVFDSVAPSTPATNVPAGSYTSVQTVTLSTDDGTATVRYTANGSTPTCDVGTVYVGALTLSSSQTITAIACDAAGNVSGVASFAYTITIASGGGGAPPAVSPSGMSGGGSGGAPLTFATNRYSVSWKDPMVALRLNADPRTVKGYAVSLDPELRNAGIVPLTSTATFMLPATTGTYTVYLRYYSITGEPSSLLTTTVQVDGVVGSFVNPANLAALVERGTQMCNTEKKEDLLRLVTEDARAFNVVLTREQVTGIRNYVLCGNSDVSVAMGLGERRALIRDYLETVQRGDVEWADMERLASGQLPLRRNLINERKNAVAILATFRRIYGHAPNFKNSEENLAWNALMYRMRFARDLSKEQAGIRAYRALYRRDPKTPFAWAVVRALGYVKR